MKRLVILTEACSFQVMWALTIFIISREQLWIIVKF